MKKRLLAFTLGLCLLAGCTAPAAETPAPTETPELTPEPTKAGVRFDTLPVTEEAVRAYYTGGRGTPGYSIVVVKVTPYEGDFLVEYTDYDIEGETSWFSILDWVFGESGRVVRLTEMEEFSSYEIEEQGKVFCVTTGQSVITGSQGLPNQYRVTVPGGAWDELETDMSDALFCYREDLDD